jgi:hypothetical protein
MTVDFTLTLISREPAWIEAADAARVQRIGIDIERLGKAARQGHVPDARISNHTLDDLRTVASRVRHAAVFARLNRLHEGTKHEVDAAIALGAQSLMLPGFRTANEVARFVDLVAGRAEVLLLLETSTAVARLHDVLRVRGVAEIMVGLNDLHLELQLASPLEVAASDLLRWIADQVRGAGIRFGFGGVAQPQCNDLPVPSDLVLSRFAQVGGRSAWISRSFFRNGLTPSDFGAALAALRSRLAFWFAQAAPDLAVAERKLRDAIRRLADRSSMKAA